MLAPFLLIVAAAPQAVRVIWPDPAVVAAARLPVPDVVMTRTEADALSDAALIERLIGHVPHRRIAKVMRQRSRPTPSWPGTGALERVSFAEMGVPLRGRLCRGRVFTVGFDTPDGKAEPTALATRGEDRALRASYVMQEPTISVVSRAATASACVDARPESVPPDQFDASAALVERLVEVRGARTAGLTLVSCFDRFASPSMRCDPAVALAALDWTKLGPVHRSAFTGEPVRWSMSVGEGDRPWQVQVEEAGSERHVTVRRDYPAPF